eukprot:355669-Pyramimonas_sp.AAC.1
MSAATPVVTFFRRSWTPGIITAPLLTDPTLHNERSCHFEPSVVVPQVLEMYKGREELASQVLFVED